MAGKRQPTSVVVAKGKKHLTQEETDARLDAEIKVEQPEKAVPPRWLQKKFHGEFAELGELLLRSFLYTDLDRDVLGQYLVTRERWARADKLAAAAIRAKDEEQARSWSSIQASYFKQCRQCAEAMGLSITSRCRLVLPKALTAPAASAPARENDDEFTQRLRERQAAALGGE